MENATYIGISRQALAWRHLEVVANNLANVSTTGFKNERMMFVEHLVRPSSPTESVVGQRLAYVKAAGTLRNTRQGQLTATDNQLDVAINGSSYFAVDTPQGLRYTRNGRFHIDNQNRLATTEGYLVLSTNTQPIIFANDTSRVLIGRDGTISTTDGILGQLQVARFENEQAMVHEANGLYRMEEAPAADGTVEIAQGMIEDSNVKAVQEVTTMIGLLRNYQAMQQMLDGEHERMRRAIDRLSRV